MLLKDRVCIVTGGSSGIGRGIALEFAREGARIVIADKREAPLRGKYHETDVETPTVTEIEKTRVPKEYLFRPMLLMNRKSLTRYKKPLITLAGLIFSSIMPVSTSRVARRISQSLTGTKSSVLTSAAFSSLRNSLSRT